MQKSEKYKIVKMKLIVSVVLAILVINTDSRIISKKTFDVPSEGITVKLVIEQYEVKLQHPIANENSNKVKEVPSFESRFTMSASKCALGYKKFGKHCLPVPD